jgi:AcrR family transcriptional regulator
MVEAAARLLAARGLEGTSLADVLAAAHAPRGSMYHHFPGGKDQLLAEAIALAGRRSLEHVAGMAGQTPEAVTRRFLEGWRELLRRTDCQAGCAVLAVAVATHAPQVLREADSVFAAWTDRLAALFVAGGAAPAAGREFATTLIAASEGAVALSRAQRRIEAFDVVAAQLLEQARNLAAALTPPG